MAESVFEKTIRNFLSPIWDHLQNPEVTEVMINGHKDIFIEVKGKIQKTASQFDDEDILRAAVTNIAQSVGRRIDNQQPYLDARLPNGYRIHAILPPAARNGTTVAIRKFFEVQMTLKDAVKNETIPQVAALFLDVAIKAGKNIVVSGGTGSGKTTLLSTLCQRIPKGQRVIIIEDSSEIRLDYEHVVFFETKHADSEGHGGVDMKQLLKSSLRLRPDRIVVGEVRGPEVCELIQAMNTGHKGCMGTLHANTALDSLFRMEALAQESDSPSNQEVLRHQISEALDLVVQVARCPDGSRKVVEIAEVLNPDYQQGSAYKVKTLFKLLRTQNKDSKEDKIVLEPTGEVPSFMDEINDLKSPLTEKYFKKVS